MIWSLENTIATFLGAKPGVPKKPSDFLLEYGKAKPAEVTKHSPDELKKAKVAHSKGAWAAMLGLKLDGKPKASPKMPLEAPKSRKVPLSSAAATKRRMDEARARRMAGQPPPPHRKPRKGPPAD